MTSTQLAAGFAQEYFDAFLADRREPAWSVALRREAWATFLATPLPDRTQEEWMRTDIRGFHFEPFAERWSSRPELRMPPAFSSPFNENVVFDNDLDGSGVAISVDDGRVGREHLDPALADRGVLFGTLDRLLSEHGDLLRPYLFAAVDYRADKFAALHAACWSGGTLLYVPKGVVIERPFHILSALTSGGVDLGHSLIVLDEGAEATVLAGTNGPDAAAAGLHCGAAELFVGPRANLRYISLQDWGTGVWHFAHHRAVVDRDASLQWTIGALGSRLAKVNQHVALVGPGANVQVNGVMFTEGRQHLSYHTLQHHQAPRCTSDLLYKGALQDHSRLVWRGMIRVDRDAQKTDGYQRDDNLILSEDARADSIPGLEIQADDVKCSHGATAGRVDDEQVFYACCRGSTRKEAVRMIVLGFFQQVFDRIEIESVRQALGEAIGRRVREFQ